MPVVIWHCCIRKPVFYLGTRQLTLFSDNRIMVNFTTGELIMVNFTGFATGELKQNPFDYLKIKLVAW